MPEDEALLSKIKVAAALAVGWPVKERDVLEV